MKTILIGTIAFLAWSSSSTYLYVCQIKGLCPDTPTQISSKVNITPEAKPEIENVETEIEKAKVTKLESPGSFVLNHEFNREEFISQKDFEPYIDLLTSYVGQNPNAKISIIGNSDNIGLEKYNYDLGLRRANFMKGFIVKLGLPSDLIIVDSKGESSPVANNALKSGRAENRRTEIEIN